MSANIRSYGNFLLKAFDAIYSSIERANSFTDPYYKESSIILAANAWELLSKALLIKHGGDNLIYEKGSRKEKTITAENAVNKLKNLGYISELQSSPIQQIISLRNEALHQTLPIITDEIVFHLEYYAIRYFKEIIDANFKSHSKHFRKQFLSVNFGNLVTYSDGVKKVISTARSKRKSEDLRLAYLLERGVSFSGGDYMKQSDFEKILLSKRTSRPMYSLNIGEYVRKADMIVVVPIQAPSGTVADINLTKAKGSQISVKFNKIATDDDYPHLTTDLSAKLGKSRSLVQKFIKDNKIKDNPQYHQRIRSGRKSFVHKYSDSALHFMSKFFDKNPDYNMKTIAV
jgi:hypothetical protein